MILGDSLEVLKTMPSDSVDSLVTDPPAGISFMGKEWDSDKGGRDKWIEWLTEVMRECYRVLKPGAHGLVWAIPRTSHWTATALENAGFEVRDVVTHLFGTGFPKSLDISKAIDKAGGAEREVLGVAGKSGSKRNAMAGDFEGGEYMQTAPSTPQAKQWSGWGTALKPSVEKWFLVRKQNLTVDTTAFDPLETVLWSRLNASNAESLFKRILATSSEARPGIVPAYALTRAVAEAARLTEIGAAEASSDQMAISPLEAVTITSLSIVWSWKSILAALSDQMSTFITRTAISQIIDYPTLNSLASAITPESIIQAANNPSGTPENVRLVGEFLNDCVQRCEGILTLYAHEHAIGAGQFNQPSLSASRKIESALRTAPFSEEIILIRKPLGEKTVAANVLKHGVGGINIDATRIRTDELAGKVYNNKGDNLSFGGTYGKGAVQGNAIGRFPANLVLSHNEDCEVECSDSCPVAELDRQGVGYGRSAGGGNTEAKQNNSNWFGKNAKAIMGINNYNDKGTVSRFFYCAKASKADRNAGCEGMPVKQTTGGGGLTPCGDKFGSIKAPAQNFHPTVKSTALMRYLCRLVTPPNGTILDPFMGSGSTGVAAVKEGFEFIGIELNPEYFEIANSRVRQTGRACAE